MRTQGLNMDVRWIDENHWTELINDHRARLVAHDTVARRVVYPGVAKIVGLNLTLAARTLIEELQLHAKVVKDVRMFGSETSYLAIPTVNEVVINLRIMFGP